MPSTPPACGSGSRRRGPLSPHPVATPCSCPGGKDGPPRGWPRPWPCRSAPSGRASTVPAGTSANSRSRVGKNWEDRVVSDDLDPLRQLRPDRIEPDDPGDPAVYSRAKERFMSTIDQEHVESET